MLLKRIFAGWRPADILDVVQFRKKEQLLARTPGPMYLVAVQGKEAGWRSIVARLTKKMAAPKRLNMSFLIGHTPDQDSKRLRVGAAKDVHGVLAAATKSMVCRTARERSYWSKHVNKNVTHHSGWLPLMQRIHILAKTSRKDPRGMCFGDEGDPKVQAYKIVPFKPQTHVETFARLSMMQQVLVSTKTPKTLDDWRDGMAEFAKKAPVMGDSYTCRWVYRSAMVAEMALANRKTLKYGKHNTMAHVQKGFPDQKGMIRTFCEADGKTASSVTVSEFLRGLRYKDGLQFLTMDLCILGVAGQGMEPKTIEAAELEIKRSRHKMDKELGPGRPAHPAIVVQKACAQ